jgi:hypothetical protein
MERYTKEQRKEWMDKGHEGTWEDATDTFESCPDMQDIMDDMNIEFLRKDNPELLEIMKQVGFNVDEEPAKKD